MLLLQLLKWQFQVKRRGKRWRFGTEGRLKVNPNLKEEFDSTIAFAYRRASIEAGFAG